MDIHRIIRVYAAGKAPLNKRLMYHLNLNNELSHWSQDYTSHSTVIRKAIVHRTYYISKRHA